MSRGVKEVKDKARREGAWAQEEDTCGAYYLLGRAWAERVGGERLQKLKKFTPCSGGSKESWKFPTKGMS